MRRYTELVTKNIIPALGNPPRVERTRMQTYDMAQNG